MNLHSPIDVQWTSKPARFNADEYIRMASAAVFDERRIELVNGELVEMAPADGAHGLAHARLVVALGIAYQGQPVELAIDTMVRLSADEVRAPDVLVRNQRRDILDFVPADIRLVVEVSVSSVLQDLNEKSHSYARAGIRMCWVIDVAKQRTHVMSNPTPGGYADTEVVLFYNPLPLPGLDTTITLA